jgi:radical SAM-linked protein
MQPDLHRLRITFAKGGPLQYTSHLDLVRAWERSLRRAGMGLAYSGGFNPRPRLQLAAALPLGHTGEAELLDVWLEQSIRTGDFVRALVPVLPAGLTMREVRQVELKGPALQTQIASAEYLATVGWDESREQVDARVARVLAAEELAHERRGRRYDLRPLIERLRLERAGAGKAVLAMQLAARAGATARPEAVLEILGMGEAFARYHRQRLLIRAHFDPRADGQLTKPEDSI